MMQTPYNFGNSVTDAVLSFERDWLGEHDASITGCELRHETENTSLLRQRIGIYQNQSFSRLPSVPEDSVEGAGFPFPSLLKYRFDSHILNLKLLNNIKRSVGASRTNNQNPAVRWQILFRNEVFKKEANIVLLVKGTNPNCRFQGRHLYFIPSIAVASL